MTGSIQTFAFWKAKKQVCGHGVERPVGQQGAVVAELTNSITKFGSQTHWTVVNIHLK